MFIEGQNVSLEIFEKGGMFMASIRAAKQRLLEEMEKLDPKSNEYSTLAARLEQLTKSEQNEKGWMGQLGCGIIQTVISAAASTVNVWNVLKHEDRGNIVTTKSLNYAPKPQEHSNSFKSSR